GVAAADYHILLHNTEVIDVYGDSDDSATLLSSEGSEHFLGGPDMGFMWGAGFAHTVWNFGHVEAHGSDAQGTDAAFYTAAGDKCHRTASGTDSTLSGTGYEVKAAGFRHVKAEVTLGGEGVALLHGFAGGNDLTATAGHCVLAEAGGDQQVE